MNDDRLESLLRATARGAAQPPADLAARALVRVRADRRRRRVLRGAFGAAALAAAAALAVVVLRPSTERSDDAPVVAQPVAPRPEAAPTPVAPTVPSAPAAEPGDLLALVAASGYDRQREALLADLGGARDFLVACVPRVRVERQEE